MLSGNFILFHVSLFMLRKCLHKYLSKISRFQASMVIHYNKIRKLSFKNCKFSKNNSTLPYYFFFVFSNYSFKYFLHKHSKVPS